MSKIITINGNQFDDFSLLITKIQSLHYLSVLHSENPDFICDDFFTYGKENATIFLNELISSYLDILSKEFDSFYNGGGNNENPN